MHHGASQNDAPPRDCRQGRRRRTFYSALVLSPSTFRIVTLANRNQPISRIISEFPFSTLTNRQFARLETIFNFHKTKAVRIF
jgi:hypothetical protein